MFDEFPQGTILKLNEINLANILRSHMCFRYEKIICYDWIIQRLLELFVYTDFIFIVTLLAWYKPDHFLNIVHWDLEQERTKSEFYSLCLLRTNWMFVWVSHTSVLSDILIQILAKNKRIQNIFTSHHTIQQSIQNIKIDWVSVSRSPSSRVSSRRKQKNIPAADRKCQMSW